MSNPSRTPGLLGPRSVQDISCVLDARCCRGWLNREIENRRSDGCRVRGRFWRRFLRSFLAVGFLGSTEEDVEPAHFGGGHRVPRELLAGREVPPFALLAF